MSLFPEKAAVPQRDASSIWSQGGLSKENMRRQARRATPDRVHGGLFINKKPSRQSAIPEHGGLDKVGRLVVHERTSLLHDDGKTSRLDSENEVALLLYRLSSNSHASHQHPKSIPSLAPEKRGKRHRNPYIWTLNQFRHWWKSSRLLVRLSGCFGYCMDPLKWAYLAALDVTRRKDARRAVKQVKRIGQGGPNRLFLQFVHPFTRTVRIILALARAWEARVDNRLYEVGIAEGMAFIGNRCFRFWSRRCAEGLARYVAFPISARLIAPFLDQQSRPVIMLMGLLRAVLPFIMSFQGSRFGRQVTFAVYRAAHYRWSPLQGILHFHEKSGAYQELDRDAHLLDIAKDVSVAIGHGEDPTNVRCNLAVLGFAIVGTGKGGHSFYRRPGGNCDWIKLRTTPYGPALLTEMPRYIILERSIPYYSDRMAEPFVPSQKWKDSRTVGLSSPVRSGEL